MSGKEDPNLMRFAVQNTTDMHGEPTQEIGREIAKQLRALYSQQISEPLPDKFVNLLDKLAKTELKD